MQELTGAPVVRWLNIELPKLQNLRVDLLGETAAGELVHIELQSSNDARMALRMAEYCLSIYRHFDRLPRQILLYVGRAPLQMHTQLSGTDFSFRYRLVDIRDLDGERLIESPAVGDNVIAVLARWQDEKAAVRSIVERIAGLKAGERDVALLQLLILSGLRRIGNLAEEEARKVPILDDILDNEVFARQYQRGLDEGLQQGIERGIERGELALLRLLIQRRFGRIPAAVEERLSGCSTAEIEALSLKLLDAKTLDELLT